MDILDVLEKQKTIRIKQGSQEAHHVATFEKKSDPG